MWIAPTCNMTEVQKKRDIQSFLFIFSGHSTELEWKLPPLLELLSCRFSPVGFWTVSPTYPFYKFDESQRCLERRQVQSKSCYHLLRLPTYLNIIWMKIKYMLLESNKTSFIKFDWMTWYCAQWFVRSVLVMPVPPTQIPEATIETNYEKRLKFAFIDEFLLSR